MSPHVTKEIIHPAWIPGLPRVLGHSPVPGLALLGVPGQGDRGHQRQVSVDLVTVMPCHVMQVGGGGPLQPRGLLHLQRPLQPRGAAAAQVGERHDHRQAELGIQVDTM